MSSPILPSISAAQRLISPSPGKKASRSPSCSRKTRLMRLAISSGSLAHSSAMFSGQSPSHSVSTGNIRPPQLRCTAPSSLEIDSVSIVADISTIFRSGLSSSALSLAIARAQSQLRLRSWNSSNMSALTPSRVGSSHIILPSMPSVSTSSRVADETLFSKRTLYPTVSPTSSPSMAAMRQAIWRAAILLGSSISMRPGRQSSISSGSSVDLPAPGSALTRTQPLSSSAFLSPPASPAAGRCPAASRALSVIPLVIFGKYT